MAGAGGVLVGRGYVSIRPEFEGDWSRSVSARASSAGKSGAGAFSKAFGVGLKGIGALAGVAIGANLNAAAAGAAVLAPALATAGAAAGALKLGLSGIGEAFKQAFADTSADATAAASATRAVESAQRGLANAQRSLADARVQAAARVRDAQKAVADAEQNLARVVEDSALRQRDAQRSVRDAEEDLRDAQRDAREAQASLTDARQEATRALQDMNTRLAESRLDEREAVLRLEEAERELQAAQANPAVTPEKLAKLQLAYDRATLNLQEQREETKRLSTDTAKANKAGVEGSEQMRRARERVASASETVADREQGLARAQEEARRTGVEAARDVADAQRSLADAQAGVAQARADGARQIADAERAVADAAAAVADAQAAATAQTSKFDEAMSKLAPNARAFVGAVQSLAPAWDAMRLSVQNELFRGLDDTVTTLGRTTIPVLQRGLTGIAGVWNEMAKSAAGAVTEMARTGMLDQILAGARDNLKAFADTPGQLVTAFGQLSVAAQPAFNALSQQMAGAITSFADGIAKSFSSGGLEQAITSAFEILSQFGTLLGNVLGTVSQIFKAASDAGGQIVGSLAAVFGELRRVLATDEMQASLRALFASVAQIVGAIVPVFGAVVQAVVPLLAAIAQPIAQLATVLGPVLVQLATTLGAALQPVIEALGPVLVTVGTAIVQLVQAVTPLLQPIADLISGVINALAPALTPIVNVVTDLVGVLIGPLTQIVQALTPALQMIGQAITQVFQALEPMLAPLVQLIGQVAELIAGVLAQALQQLMPILGPLIDTGTQLMQTVFAALEPLLPVISDALHALGAALLQMLPAFGEIAAAAVQFVEGLAPLIPIGVQLVTEVLGALTPVLPTIADAFVQIAKAVLGLAVPLGGLVASLAQQLAPVIADLAPILGELVSMFAGLLAEVLPPLTDSLVLLVQGIVPIIPVFGQLVGMVLQMGAGLIVQLLPAILQLVQASIDLLVALLPLVPPLVQLIGLVVQLAAKVLVNLLPPLLSFASFLIGGLAGALSTVIGWVSGLISGIAGLISWVVDRLAPAFRNFKDRVIIPVWNAIRNAVTASWSAIKTYVLFPIRDFFTVTVPGWASTLRNKVIAAWTQMRDGFSNTWGQIKRNILYPIRDFFTKTVPGWANTLKDKFVGAFEAARKGIADAWEGIKKATKDPIKWVIDVVYNEGVRGLWNAAAKVLPIDKLEKFTPKGWARGGVIPGYQSAKRDDVLTPMRSGEGVLVPEAVRGIGPGTVHALNAAGNRGGVGAVRRLVHGYAEGGIVGHHGGIDDWFGGTLDKLGGLVDKGKDWILGGVHKAASAAAKPIRDLIGKIPGGTTGFGALAKALPTALLDKALSFIKGSEDSQMGGGQWVKPVDAKYGTRFGVAGRMWSSGRHTGLDFPAAVGKAVYAVANGQIASARSGGPYGNHILINHGQGLQSLYAHLSAITRAAGSVQAGQTIGRVGATGNVTGPHLHLEARVNGTPVDPMAYLTGGGSGGGSGGKGVQRWRGVVNQALGLVGQPRSLADTTLRRMNQESGGDPNIVNRWDSNWAAGHPSVGLMQVIGPTFRAFAGRFRNTGPFSYGVSTNPLANVYASMRYALAQYGSLPRAYNRPGGYDSGGWLGPGQIGVNHLRQPEAVLTPGQWRDISVLATRGTEASRGLQPGDRLALRVADYEFDAYVERVADGRVTARDNRMGMQIAAGRRQ
ncbi:peptidoglycan DD-metalloendopeptidase family protein [Streptomyces rochei]|uniref:peptidoglycan DD-metalloendopeptidase family protein n=1 Tax=Streptomyces rochei TaxID=1928 RepID=UPI002ACD9B39|nr:peptidoglycan DD-metalloendopeptidase family protein [Streptomyces rochei]WQC12551.1 peptidoglycan DD-metalloendopeptidase family protein [Streptomyces rochei]